MFFITKINVFSHIYSQNNDVYFCVMYIWKSKIAFFVSFNNIRLKIIPNLP